MCGSAHTYVDRYREQVLTGIPDTPLKYIYKNRRYRCQKCGKTFSEDRTFIDAYQRMPHSVIESIVREHRELISAAYIARRHDISSKTVMRHFARVGQLEEQEKLNTVISMDEFCGNVGAKYQVIINDLRSRRCCNVMMIDAWQVSITRCSHIRHRSVRMLRWSASTYHRSSINSLRSVFRMRRLRPINSMPYVWPIMRWTAFGKKYNQCCPRVIKSGSEMRGVFCWGESPNFL